MMNVRIKGSLVFFFFFFFLLMFLLSSGIINLLSSGMINHGGVGTNHRRKGDQVRANSRKLMRFDTLDYDYAGPNPKHDPRGKRGGGGGGGKNP